MNDKDWLILKCLDEERNLTRAADRLYLSQPALTYRLQQLEKELAVPILVRERRGIRLTSQGEELVKYARAMLVEWQRMKEQLFTMDAKVAGTLRLGVSNTLAAYRLPALLKPFMQRYPDVEVKVTTHWSSELLPQLTRQELHVGLIRGDYAWQGGRHLLWEEPLYVVADAPFELDQLPALPRINYKTEPSLQAILDQWWVDRFQAPPTVAMEVDSMETGKKMVQGGLGYAVLPSIVLEGDASLTKHALMDRQGAPLLRRSWMIYPREVTHSLLADTFVHYIKGLSWK